MESAHIPKHLVIESQVFVVGDGDFAQGILPVRTGIFRSLVSGIFLDHHQKAGRVRGVESIRLEREVVLSEAEVAFASHGGGAALRLLFQSVLGEVVARPHCGRGSVGKEILLELSVRHRIGYLPYPEPFAKSD